MFSPFPTEEIQDVYRQVRSFLADNEGEIRVIQLLGAVRPEDSDVAFDIIREMTRIGVLIADDKDNIRLNTKVSYNADNERAALLKNMHRDFHGMISIHTIAGAMHPMSADDAEAFLADMAKDGWLEEVGTYKLYKSVRS